MKTVILTICLAISSLLRADTLSDVRSALQSLKGQAPLSLRVERHTWDRENGKDRSEQETFGLEDGPKGLRRTDGKALPGGDLKAENLTRAHLNLLELLRNSSVIDEHPGLLDGKPVRKLCLSLLPEKDLKEPSSKVKFKKCSMELTLWIGPDHFPLAMDMHIEMEGRAMLLMKFSTKVLDHRRYEKIKDRLVVLEVSSEGQFKGMGQDGAGREILRCAIQ